MSQVKALELENWANVIEARQRLPQLLRRLSHATVEDLTRIDFPADEGVQRPGWDGLTETNTVHPFVPQGVAVWELGCDRDSKTKADEDYDKRTENSLGLDPSQTTYISVTPRKWTKKEDWCKAKNEEKVWKEVRVYDSANLEEWLETARAVDLWFARILGRSPSGAVDITQYWENLADLTNPPLQPQVFLTSRGGLRNKFAAWLLGGPSALAIEATSPVEVIDFFAAHLAALPKEERDVFESRIVIVENRDAWSSLAGSRNRLILVPTLSLSLEPEVVAQAVRNGHHVLICSHNFGTTYPGKQILPRLVRYELEKALTASGLDEERARRLALDSGGSLTVVKRRLSRFPSTRRPLWSEPPASLALVPFLLAGSWNDACEPDQEAMAKLSGRPYSDVIREATRWTSGDDPPLRQIGSSWSITSREDSLELLSSSITRQDLDSFEAVATEVLGENDARWELSSDERWRAVIHGKVRRYSEKLRSGLVETLAVLGAKGASLGIQDSVGPSNRAIRLIRALLPKGAGWQRWATLAEHLPLIAEASPDAFFDAVEADLQTATPQLIALFAEEGNGVFGPSPHPGLLWALEGLAWEPSYLSRAALILSRLAQSDPGGALANRPGKSLQEIFLPWHPSTLATPDQRLRTLDLIIKRYPDVGWKLLLFLLPDALPFATSTRRPSWRGANHDWTQRPSQADYFQHVQAIADRLLAHAANNNHRWHDLIKSFEHLPKAARARVIVGLKAIDPATLGDREREKVATELREKIVHHRRFADTSWALPEDVLIELDSVREQLEPSDPVTRFSWLFVGFPRVPGETQEQSWEDQQAAVFEARKIALQETLASGGIAKVLDLARASEAPWNIGYVLANSKLIDDLTGIVPDFLAPPVGKLNLLANGAVSGRFAADSWAWAASQPLTGWSPEQAAFFLTNLPFERQTWDLVDGHSEDVKTYYWKGVFPFVRSISSEDAERAVRCLLTYSRPLRAVEVIAQAHMLNCEIAAALTVEALEANLTKGESVEPLLQTTRFHIQNLFLRLQSDTSLDQGRLARLEWAYLPFLDEHSHARPKTLYASFQQAPALFAEALKTIFRPRNSSQDERQPFTEEEAARAQNAYALLKSWKTIPGRRDNGTIDSVEIQKWVDSARQLCRDADRLEVCDTMIGELLAHCEAEADGTWPCIPVREVLELSEGANMLDGFEIGIFNKRGVVSRGFAEGGEQERELVSTYDSYAGACDIDSPRVAGALRKVADMYRNEARREDLSRESML
jgi:hypothetical protein